MQHQSADIAQQLQSAKEAEGHLQESVRSLEQRLSGASEALAERERQCQALEELQVVSEHALNDLRSREALARKGRESAVAESSATTQGAREEVSRLNVMLESTNTRLRDVQRQNADLEMKNVQLTKTQKQLEDDNAGLYIGLEAKQQELDLVRYLSGRRVIRADCFVDETQVWRARNGRKYLRTRFRRQSQGFRFQGA